MHIKTLTDLSAFLIFFPQQGKAHLTPRFVPAKSASFVLNRSGPNGMSSCFIKKCGGKMKIIGTIEDLKVIRKILEHMGLALMPPPLYPAREPPKHANHIEDEHLQQHSTSR